MKLPKVPLAGFLGFASFFLIPVTFAVAQSQGLVPCGGASGAENYLQATACNLCDLGKLIQGLINFLIGLAIPIAALLVAWAGVLYFTAGGDFTKHAKALSIFKHVILGFVLALTSWLIVQTLLYALFKNSYYQGWNNIQCSSESRPRSAPINSLLAPLTGLNANPYTPGASVVCDELDLNCATGQTASSHSEVARVLADSSIGVYSSGGCSDPTKSTCTSFVGMQQSTVDQVLNIKAACPSCSIVVTGGTEAGHSAGDASHSTGYKVDLDDTPTLNTYFQTVLTPAGTRSGDPRYLDSAGNEYVKESTHWDITVKKTTPLPTI